ncbi:ClpP/crotonase-like domain-containing protein [Scleroderma yunnanense]
MTSGPSQFTIIPPATSTDLKVSFPQEHVLLLTLNRPDKRNSVSPTLSDEIGRVLAWFDEEPSLWVVIITGEGQMFCAGADLKVWHEKQLSGRSAEPEDMTTSLHGFASISRRRTSLKPMIAAVNGPAYGGGVELILNCDLVIASRDAVFALPEVKRGVMAAQGVIPRLARTSGHQLASEMLLLGNPISAVEARDRYRFVNTIVAPASVLPTALSYARVLTSNSPDSVQSTKEGLLFAQRTHIEEAVQLHATSAATRRLWKGGNIKEGLAAFTERRTPKWTAPAKL